MVALSGAGLVVNKLWRNTLTAEASKTEAALKSAEQFKSIAIAQITEAATLRTAAYDSDKRARRAENRAVAAIEHADSMLAWAPDTCAPFIAAQKDAQDELQHALDEQKRAFGQLQAAARQDSLAHASLLAGLGTATDAAQDLVDATHRSFFAGLLPKIGVGVSAGITPQGKFDVVAGPTLHWDF